MKRKNELVQRVDFIKKACQEKKVLHLGCTAAPFTKESIKNNRLLHSDLRDISQELFGFDNDKEGLSILRENGMKHLFLADLEKLDNIEFDKTFDVIIAGETIEHLSNPGLFLRGIRRFMNDKTSLIITTPNAYCAIRNIIYFLKGKDGSNEPVHPDHVAYYSYKTLKLAINRENLTIEDFRFYDIGDEYRPQNNKIANLINDVFVKFKPYLGEGVIAVCRKQ